MGNLGRLLNRWVRGSSVAGLIGGQGKRSVAVPGWAALVLAFACLGGGILIGRNFVPAAPGPGLVADGAGRQAPAMIDEEAETAPLANDAFVVAAYEYRDEAAEAAAKRQAMNLSKTLRDKGLQLARPYRYAGPDRDGASRRGWFVAVYYSGRTQLEQTRDALRDLADQVTEKAFVDERKRCGEGWPQSVSIR